MISRAGAGVKTVGSRGLMASILAHGVTHVSERAWRGTPAAASACQRRAVAGSPLLW